MNLVFAALILLATSISSSVCAAEFLTIGKDTTILHSNVEFTLFGRRVTLDPLDAISNTMGRPYAIDVDTDALERLTGITPNPFAVRRSSGLQNGFAALRGSERYI